ncbi:MAG: tRNA epoxyqueuosine(34) reductase QueG [Verrucomicrobiae bacterium]|nr:tRNA epoxyqueuosine(34) reductase QueG [Verrucomicrobiae bacterium]
MKEMLRQRARALGFDDCRFTTADPPASAAHFQAWLDAGRHGEMAYLQRNAARRLNPQLVLPGARSVICLAVSYDSAIPKSEIRNPKSGLIARYARFADYHEVLGKRLKHLADFVDQLGGPGTRSLWYVDTGPVLEREFAQRAGVGFIGKHTNVINRKLGNWIFLAEILTTLELSPDVPEKNRCGTCTRCLAACPTNAITAPFQLDAPRCISYLTIELKGPIPVALRPAIGNRIFGCDDCLAVCPWNRFAHAGSLMSDHARRELGTLDLLELLELDEARFRARFAGTPLLRTKRRGLLRNVCVALGNVGDAGALPALRRAAMDAEPLIAEHARWAMERITARASTGTAPVQPH